MPTYVARFTVGLKFPIHTNETTLPALRVPGGQEPVAETLIRVEPSNGLLRELKVEVIYSSDHLVPATIAGSPASEGIVLCGKGGIIHPPWHTAIEILAPLLYQISGLTLQAHAYWDLIEDLPTHVRDFTWQMPDGTIVPSASLEPPIRVLRNLPDSGIRALSLTDWNTLQAAMTGSGSGAPLWRLILADGYRERVSDMRNVVVRCATALDVGIAQYLLVGERFDLRLLRGELVGARTLDLRTTDPTLYETLARLWYTRHGIVHKGEVNLYDRNPQSGVSPLRPLTMFDVDEFLCAVPRSVAFVEANPP